jgi:hypothetical protein
MGNAFRENLLGRNVMKRYLVLVSLCLFLLPCCVAWGQVQTAPPAPASDPNAAVGLFYNQLLPYGQWIWVASCGWVWCPNNIPLGWRPYTVGYWENTDCGWAWASDEPWGWACYHYGRWFYETGYGWVWCPDSEWAPAWVVWRCGDDWIGWAPCPPGLRWRNGFVTEGVDWDTFFPARHFTFVSRDDFLRHDLSSRIVQHARNVTIVKGTKLSASIEEHDGRIFNSLPVQDELEKRLGHAIPQLRITEADSALDALHEPVYGAELRVFRPERHVAGAARAATGPVESAPLPPEREAQLRTIRERQAGEQKALENQRAAAQGALKEQQSQELKAAKEETAQRQLQSEHEEQNKAFQEETQRQKELLSSAHEREKNIVSAPGAPSTPPAQRFDFGAPSQTPTGGTPGRH